MKYHITRVSANRKTGPIPVTTTSSDSCPDACPLKGNGCYAEQVPLGLHWRSNMRLTLDELTQAIRELPDGQLWRHNQAGDLPGEGDRIDWSDLCRLVEANRGRRGFTYTHKPVADHPYARHNRECVAACNGLGFTVNLSADNLAEADQLSELGIGPVVTILPRNQLTNTQTPAGRKVVVCPAITHERTTCATCGLCQRAGRSVVVGFPAHGILARRAEEAAG